MRSSVILAVAFMLVACGHRKGNEIAEVGGEQEDASAEVGSEKTEVVEDLAADGKEEIGTDTVADSIWEMVEEVAEDLVADGEAEVVADTVGDGIGEMVEEVVEDLVVDSKEEVVDDVKQECPEVCPESEDTCLVAACLDGECGFEPDNEGMSCEDDNLCTVDDTCLNGDCEPGIPVVCDDGDMCTIDSCDPALGCVFEDPPTICWPTPALELRIPLWGAPFSKRIHVDDDYLYATAKGSFRVFNIPALISGDSPPQVSRIFDYGAIDVLAEDGFAYLAGDNDLVVIDMEVPHQPLVRGVLEVNLDILARRDQYIVGAGGDSAYVILTEDPDEPEIIATIEGLGGGAQDLILATDYLYVVTHSGTLEIINVQNISAPVFVKQLNPMTKCFSVAAADGYLYVGGQVNGESVLKAYNLDDPENPTESWSADVGSSSSWGVMGITIDNGFMFIQVWKSGTNFRVYDLSNPASPSEVHASNRPGSGGNDIVIHEKTAYVTCGNAGIRLYDINNPASPDAFGVVSAAQARSLTKVGNLLYFADSGSSYGAATGVVSGFKIFDVSDVANPILQVNDEANLKVPLEMKNNTSHILVADNSGGLKIFDISVNPLNSTPTQLGGSARNSTSVGDNDLLYVLRWPDKLETIDISNPSNPSVVSTFSEAGIVHGQGEVHYEDGKLYVANYNLPFRIMDASSNPPQVALLGSVDMGGKAAWSVALRDNIAWVLTYEGSIHLVDISDPTVPVISATIPPPVSPAGGSRVRVHGDYGFVAYGQAGVGIYGIDDPLAPELLGLIPPENGVRDLFFDGSYLYCLEEDNSLFIVGGF
jgi:hypothetical protein